MDCLAWRRRPLSSMAERQAFSGPVEFTTEGMHTLEFWSVDAAGDEETHQTANVNVDETEPFVLVSQSPGANSSGWNNTDVTVHFDCFDGRSGVAELSGRPDCMDRGSRSAGHRHCDRQRRKHRLWIDHGLTR